MIDEEESLLNPEFALYSTVDNTIRFFKGVGGVTETIKITNSNSFECRAEDTIADHHIAHIKFIVQKDDDYLGFGCKKFLYF